MPTITVPNDFTVSAHSMSLAVSNLPMTSIIYLLANGYSQSLGDAGTSAVAKAKLAALKVANEARGKGNAMSKTAETAFLATDTIVAMCEAAATDAKNKRQLALEEGTMVFGSRGPNGPRLSPLDAFMLACAEADAKARAISLGKPMQKGEALETLLMAIIDLNHKKYEERFEKAQVSDSAMDKLTALFG